MKLPKTKKEVNDYIRSRASAGNVTSGELSDSQMNEYIRSGGVMPEKKTPPAKPLTPEQAVEVLEIMNSSGMTYTQAKAKFQEAEAEKAKTAKNMNDYIRARSGRGGKSESETEGEE